jgi:hypothetical protein
LDTNTNIKDSITTPRHLHDQEVTDTISAALQNSTNDDDEPEAKWGKYIHLIPDQLSQIFTTCFSQVLLLHPVNHPYL